ncbi:MAG: hypothetical protein ACRC37_02615, partial [Lentisphaeria bacterium]
MVTMKEAARLIYLATGVPIIVTNDAAKVVVDLYLQKVTAAGALDAICKVSNLWYQRSESNNMIQVMTMEELKSSLQFIREERVEVVQVLYPAAKDIADAIAKLYINRVIWIEPNSESGDQTEYVESALSRMDIMANRGTFDIGESSGGSSSSSSSRNNNSRNSNSRNNNSSTNSSGNMNQSINASDNFNLEQINDNTAKNLLSMQNNALMTNLKFHEFSNTPGVVFISVLPENNSLMLRSTDANSIEQILKLVKQLDKPSPQVLLEVKVLSILLDDSKQRAIDFLFSNDSGKYSGGFANGYLDGTVTGQEILKPNVNLVPQGTGIDAQSAIFNVVGNNFRARVQMLERDQRVTQLATPS